MPDLKTLAIARTHELLAELVQLGVHLDAPLTVSAQADDAFLQVILTIARWERAQLHLRPGVELSGLAGSPAVPVEDDEPGFECRREIRDCILQAAPAPGKRPVTMKRLAKDAGYAYTGYFRGAVNELIDAGKLRRCSRGVARA